MGEILPNGEIQGYTGICQKCKKGISVNIQGDELGKHKCGINVLSLFDGMSCGQLALNRTNIKYNKYYASEIDKYAQIVSKANYPNTVYLGDVRNINVSELDSIDLLIGGSPCQSFSFAGKRKGMATKDNIEILNLEAYLSLKEQGFEFEGQSYLFWEYMRILTEIRKYNPNVKFLLENVIMGSKWQKILTRAIGINPICINSALVSAQNRERLYWTNINAGPDGFFGDDVCRISNPKDKGILLRDVLEDEVDAKYFLSDKVLKSISEKYEKHNPIEKSPCLTTEVSHGTGRDFTPIIAKEIYFAGLDINKKSRTLRIGVHQSSSDKHNFDLIVHNMMHRSGDPMKGGPCHLSRKDGKTYCLDTGNTNAVEIINKDLALTKLFSYNQDNPIDENKPKYNCLRANAGGKLNGIGLVQYQRIRRLTPIECERLQTVPDNYTNYVSDTQRYKMLGNGWTIDVIAHIFSFLDK